MLRDFSQGVSRLDVVQQLDVVFVDVALLADERHVVTLVVKFLENLRRVPVEVWQRRVRHGLRVTLETKNEEDSGA